MRLGQVVMRKVAVVKLGVDNGSGDGGSCFGIEVWTDTVGTCEASRFDSNSNRPFRFYSIRQDRESSPARDRRSTTEPRHQPVTSRLYLSFYVICKN